MVSGGLWEASERKKIPSLPLGSGGTKLETSASTSEYGRLSALNSLRVICEASQGHMESVLRRLKKDMSSEVIQMHCLHLVTAVKS